MRKLMWFAVGFAAAMVAAAYLLSVMWLLLLVPTLVIAAVVCRFFPWQCRAVIMVILIGCIAGALYYTGFHFLYLAGLKACDGTSQNVTIETTDYSYQTGYGYGVDGTAKIGGITCNIRLFYGDEMQLKPGDTVSGEVRLRYTVQEGIKTSSYHQGEGIFLLAYANESLNFMQADSVPVKYFASQLRKYISERISEIFQADTSGFARALLLGDDSGMEYSENVSYQKSGIRHIIAVSGLHVSILFSVVYFMTGRRDLPTLLLGLPVLFLFAAVAGFTPSVVRACIMQSLIILSMAVNREYDCGTSLAFSVLVMLCINPLTITSVSFQLSVGSMLGIFLFSGRISNYLLNTKALAKLDSKSRMFRFLRFLVSSASVSVGAMIFTLPLCAWYFGMVSVISVLTNLAALWVVSFVFCGIMVSCLLSMIWMPAGTAAAWVVSWPIRYIQLSAFLFSRVPGGTAYTESIYTVIWIVSVLVLLLIFLVCRRKSPLLLSVAVVAFYVLSLASSWLEPYLDTVRLTVLDVGQGQCVLLQSRDSAYLLDCGGEDPQQVADAALHAMGAQGITRLDGIILTHFDKDHANAAEYLLQVAAADRLYLPDSEADNAIRLTLENQRVPITWITETAELSCGVGKLTLFPAEMPDTGNESSMSILYQGENCAILVTGDRDIDGESSLLRQGTIPKLDVLVVGHHGACTSTGWELLNRTEPEVAVISVGADNLHNHPDSYTLDRLIRFGCIVRRTDQEGTIIIRG